MHAPRTERRPQCASQSIAILILRDLQSARQPVAASEDALQKRKDASSGRCPSRPSRGSPSRRIRLHTHLCRWLQPCSFMSHGRRIPPGFPLNPFRSFRPHCIHMLPFDPFTPFVVGSCPYYSLHRHICAECCHKGAVSRVFSASIDSNRMRQVDPARSPSSHPPDIVRRSSFAVYTCVSSVLRVRSILPRHLGPS